MKNVTVKTLVDESTGELTVVEEEKHYSVKTSTESFYMTFIENMSGFFKIRSITDVHILAKLCMNAEFNTGKVLLPTSLRKEIEQELGITTQTMSNSLTRLKGLGLIRGEKGAYEINERVFWKGDSQTRAKLLKKNNGMLKFEVKL